MAASPKQALLDLSTNTCDGSYMGTIQEKKLQADTDIVYIGLESEHFWDLWPIKDEFVQNKMPTILVLQGVLCKVFHSCLFYLPQKCLELKKDQPRIWTNRFAVALSVLKREGIRRGFPGCFTDDYFELEEFWDTHKRNVFNPRSLTLQAPCWKNYTLRKGIVIVVITNTANPCLMTNILQLIQFHAKHRVQTVPPMFLMSLHANLC